MVLHNIGSDSWHSVLSNLDNTAMDVLVKRCIEDTKWNNILEMCTNLRKSVRCKLSDKFSCGTQHLVRLIEFDDHVKWVVRIRFQEPDYRNAEEAMNSQVATYKFLKYVFNDVQLMPLGLLADHTKRTNGSPCTRSTCFQSISQ